MATILCAAWLLSVSFAVAAAPAAYTATNLSSRQIFNDYSYLQFGKVWQCPAENSGVKDDGSNNPHLGINSQTFGYEATMGPTSSAAMRTPAVKFALISRMKHAAGTGYYMDTAVSKSMNGYVTSLSRAPGVVCDVASGFQALSYTKKASQPYGVVYLRHSRKYANIVTLGGQAVKYTHIGVMRDKNEFRPYYNPTSGGSWMEAF